MVSCFLRSGGLPIIEFSTFRNSRSRNIFCSARSILDSAIKNGSILDILRGCAIMKIWKADFHEKGGFYEKPAGRAA